VYCGICGRPLSSPNAGGQGETGAHAACDARRGLEPPRYCARCGRRMVVQVTPSGWTARCSAHGAIAAPLL